MSENPLYTVPETPVLDPNIFLLRVTNRAFVERRTDFPSLKANTFTISSTPAKIIGLLFLGVLFFAITPFLLLIGELTLLLGVVVLFVFLGLLLIAYRAPDTEDIAGWIIPGTVTHSEKIRIQHPNFGDSDILGVRYEFAAPGGVVMEGYAEGDSKLASDHMAPAPGAPVRVWYDDDGTYYLL